MTFSGLVLFRKFYPMFKFANTVPSAARERQGDLYQIKVWTAMELGYNVLALTLLEPFRSAFKDKAADRTKSADLARFLPRTSSYKIWPGYLYTHSLFILSWSGVKKGVRGRGCELGDPHFSIFVQEKPQDILAPWSKHMLSLLMPGMNSNSLINFKSACDG